MKKDTLRQFIAKPSVIKWGTLGLFCLAIFLTWAYIHWIHAVSFREDKWLSSLVAVSWTVGLGASIRTTKRFTVRHLGMLGSIFGDILIYGSIALGLWGWYTADQWVQELLRAAFMVSAPLFALSLVVSISLNIYDWRQRRRERRKMNRNVTVVQREDT